MARATSAARVVVVVVCVCVWVGGVGGVIPKTSLW